jgi:hypothetical protein
MRFALLTNLQTARFNVKMAHALFLCTLIPIIQPATSFAGQDPKLEQRLVKLQVWVKLQMMFQSARR